MALKDWGFGKRDDYPPWPELEAGQPVSPAYLTHLNSTDMEGQIVISMLESSGIPVVTQYPHNGSFGRVILGFSGSGVDIYVPETMLDDARVLIAGDFEEDTDDV